MLRDVKIVVADIFISVFTIISNHTYTNIHPNEQQKENNHLNLVTHGLLDTPYI